MVNSFRRHSLLTSDHLMELCMYHERPVLRCRQALVKSRMQVDPVSNLVCLQIALQVYCILAYYDGRQRQAPLFLSFEVFSLSAVLG